MANTLIQIKRSQTSATPASLNIAEPAYSFNSDKLFIGGPAGEILPIGGGYYVNAAINAYNTANNAASSSMPYANSVGAAANAYALSIGTAGNNYSVSIGAASNNYATGTFYAKTGGNISGDVSISGNLTVTGETTYANTQTLNIGDNIFTLNADLPGAVAPTENAGMEVNRGSSVKTALIWDEGLTSWSFTNDGTNYYKIASNAEIAAGNAYTVAVGTAGNNYSVAIGSSGNAYALATATDIGTAGNNYTVAVGAAGNAYALSVATSIGTAGNNYTNAVGTAANNWASDAAHITTGTLGVARGGTGNTTFVTNGILFGNGTNPVQVTGAGTEGQVLQASAAGVPQFGMLDGGSF